MSKKKILVVEDDQNYLQSIIKAFKNHEIEILEAVDGLQALEIAQAQIPNLILLDIMLPKMLGLALVEKLKAKQETESIPILVITNFGGKVNKQQALDAGVNEFFVKAEITTKQLIDYSLKYLT